MFMKSAKEKLDEKLGITDINDLFNQSDIDAILNDSKIAIANIDKTIKDKAKEIDDNTSIIKPSEELSKNINQNIQQVPPNIYDIEASLGEISYLITTGKSILGNLYKYITDTEFVDPDVVSATAKIMEASRISISDAIELYKEKMQMAHAYTMEMQKHKNRLELEEHKAMLKHKYALMNGDDDNKTTDLISYTQESIIKAINDSEKLNSHIDV